MVKEETRKFVQNNRKLLREVASRTDSPVAPLAAAFLTAVDREGDERSREAEPASGDTDGNSATGSQVKLEDIQRGEDIAKG